MKKLERTSYETNPVQSPEDALFAFVEAYDVLQAVLPECDADGELVAFSEELRVAFYRPVSPKDGDFAPISLYEAGVVFSHGSYKIDSRKLKKALIQREADIRALFVQSDGILPSLCEMLPAFLETPRHEFVYTAVMRFLNECRRMTAMYA
jgi:hypothetical protein